MTLSIPRDPIALMAARLALGLMALLVVLALLPRQDAPLAPVVRAQQVTPLIIVVTPTVQAGPEPPAPAEQPMVVPTAVSPAPATVAASDPPPSQLVRHADGSISLPGSETWMAPQPNVVQQADPSLEIERAAAEAYRELPIAVAPSESNTQPNRARRPHTGR